MLTHTKLQLGSDLAEFHIKFCLTHAIQALTKVGYNLLAFFCKSTPVNRTTFLRTVEWITKCKHMPEFGDERKFGFIKPDGVAQLACPPRSHRFRLTHDPTTNAWKMYASFFEGKAAAYAAFNGPNNESWATMDVVAPYDCPMLAPVFDDWYRPFDYCVVMDPREILPTIPWHTGELRARRDPILS